MSKRGINAFDGCPMSERLDIDSISSGIWTCSLKIPPQLKIEDYEK